MNPGVKRTMVLTVVATAGFLMAGALGRADARPGAAIESEPVTLAGVVGAEAPGTVAPFSVRLTPERPSQSSPYANLQFWGATFGFENPCCKLIALRAGPAGQFAEVREPTASFVVQIPSSGRYVVVVQAYQRGSFARLLHVNSNTSRQQDLRSDQDYAWKNYGLVLNLDRGYHSFRFTNAAGDAVFSSASVIAF
jgi:hypothetical protein